MAHHSRPPNSTPIVMPSATNIPFVSSADPAVNQPIRPGGVPFLDVKAAYDELRTELDAGYRRVMDSGCYILGEEVEAFEQEFAAYCGVRHCTGVANGLDSLHLMLRAAGIGSGDEVIGPFNTYIATCPAVTHACARPGSVEPDPITHHIH